MNPQKLEKILSLMKSYGVEYFRHEELEIKIGSEPKEQPAPQTKEQVKQQILDIKTPPSQAAPPVESNIPHHVNEVANLLKLSDDELVDKLFPEYAPPKEGN